MTEFLTNSIAGLGVPQIVATIVLFAIGLLLIIKGGDWFVDAATWMANVTGIPKFIVGATVVSLATTLPELLVSTLATAQGSNEIAIGNAVGSVTANVGLIMAISIAVLPMVMKDNDIIIKGFVMLGATALLGVLCIRGVLTVWAGLLLLVVLAFFTYMNIAEAKKHLGTETEREKPTNVPGNILKFVIGAAAIVCGAQLLVDNGGALARHFGVSEKLIAVTMVAIGTSLPELVTTITALVKKEPGMSVGNIVGANIIDMTMILPVCAIVSGGKLTVPIAAGATLPALVWLDIPVTLGLMAIAVLPTLKGKKFRRWQGIVMMAAYIGYIVAVSMI